MFRFIYRYLIPVEEYYPTVRDIVCLCISAGCRKEADAIAKYSINPAMKLFMVERYDEKNKTYIEEEI